ncbi:MAG: ribonuclease III [bacterium]
MNKEIMTKLEGLEKEMGIDFKNKQLLNKAFVHRSFLNENNTANESNERLEFLGDAVLELIITEFLYEKYKKNEGELTAIRSALVRGKNLSDIADTLGLYDYLLLSIGEKKSSQKAKSLILANTLEALIGAIYLDQGYETAKQFIIENVASNVDTVLRERLYIDSKSELQEKVQEIHKLTPHYKVIKEKGPDHNKNFTSGVFVGEDLVTEGEGSSKNLAEQDAATKALVKLFG